MTSILFSFHAAIVPVFFLPVPDKPKLSSNFSFRILQSALKIRNLNITFVYLIVMVGHDALQSMFSRESPLDDLKTKN